MPCCFDIDAYSRGGNKYLEVLIGGLNKEFVIEKYSVKHLFDHDGILSKDSIDREKLMFPEMNAPSNIYDINEHIPINNAYGHIMIIHYAKCDHRYITIFGRQQRVGDWKEHFEIEHLLNEDLEITQQTLDEEEKLFRNEIVLTGFFYNKQRRDTPDNLVVLPDSH